MDLVLGGENGMKKPLRAALQSLRIFPFAITWCAGLVTFPYCLKETKLSEIMLARIVDQFGSTIGLNFYAAFFVLLYGPAILCSIALRWVEPRGPNAPNPKDSF